MLKRKRLAIFDEEESEGEAEREQERLNAQRRAVEEKAKGQRDASIKQFLAIHEEEDRVPQQQEEALEKVEKEYLEMTVPDPSIATGEESYFQRRQRLAKERLNAEAAQRPEGAAVRESRQRAEGLYRPISAENKGHQLLQKLGYKLGERLGKQEDAGLAEPIMLAMPTAKAGIGHTVPTRMPTTEAVDPEKIETQTFRDQQMSGHRQKYLVRQVYKARRTVQSLDEAKEVQRHLLWVPLPPAPPPTDETVVAEEEIEEEEDSFLLYPLEDQVAMLIDYLRETYYYCLWCGCAYNDKTDLLAHCPGPDEEAHDLDVS